MNVTALPLAPPLALYISPFGVAAVLCLVWMASGAEPLPLGVGLGALLFGFFITPFATIALAPYWLFALGGLFILVTLLLPDGIVGTAINWWNARRRRTTRDKDAPNPGGLAEPRPAE